ncbi:fimbrial protein [Enterobacter sp. CC120223-11]|uniref:fimbrial protein n=1 Tax=Enterobacter sp. CC120223-11 TaxID=1378073 RepID=UPI000BD9CF5F|nr:fimbrial protein [Enterobacter sp. CC120223-11]SNY80353.1 Pilin (type 1 fimbria component protein) [Enterobacter sp. CC120223-11]
MNMIINNNQWGLAKRMAIFSRLLILLTGVLFFSQNVWADVACQRHDPLITQAVNISPTVSYAGNDMPTGSTIYRLKMQVSTNPGVYCDGPFDLTSYWGVANEPLGAPTIIGGKPVYPTNVPGVGVVLWSSQLGGGNGYFSKSAPMPYGSFKYASQGSQVMLTTVDVSLIKTGDIPSGAVVDATKIPGIELYFPATTGYSGLPFTMQTATFTGSISFVTQTCTTPDVTVNLGSYDVSKFTAIGTTTAWKDASIVMQNCPAFTNYYGGGLNSTQYIKDSGTVAESPRDANIFTVSLTPANSVTNNIISLDSGADAATGVGVQMGYSTSVDAAATPPQNLWTAGTSWDLTAPTDGRNTVSIPLAARYYQTGNTITPGKANTKITVNIDYK